MNVAFLPLAQSHQVHELAIEEHVVTAVQWLRLGVEVIGAALVAVGVVVAIVHLCRSAWVHRATRFTSTRLILARYLALALEFQLGADILSTAVAPSWDQIGKLGAIAVIRTVLNFFLSREMKEEEEMVEHEKHTVRGSPTAG
ncbi:MAG: protein of unknown function DUF1622 [uncultured Chthoniobacterales bacterium]|uniref:DUF1622 domain-containing protein n=1 Tax=uncultured Chthoniobacterales bacterium TaxID=1836801 RepID=A0A6J4J928_9BACT|nr:MAG: protein of unknown function DUF1622 [uncultured Chthoniobacterales bacterium]